MSDFIKSFIKKTKPQLLKTKKYLSDNDWSNHVTEYDQDGKPKKFNKEGEFDVQDKAVKIIVNRLKYFIKKSDGDHHLKIFKDFVKEANKIIEIHTERVDNYINSTSLEDITTTDLKKAEMDFHNTLYEKLSSIEDAILAFNIRDDAQDTSGIVFFDNVKAPLCMHETLVEIYPEIKRKIEAMKIDFTTPPKNEMLIYMDNVPVWNVDKHYFEQEKDTLQFYVEEFKKIKNGISIDGQPIEPWLYFHMNHFVTEIPTPTFNKVTGQIDIKKKVQIPPLRDNEWYIIQDNYRQAKIDGRMLFIAATRRLFKSTGLASHLHHIAITGGKELVVAGGSAKDLGQLEKNVKVSMLNCNPAFSPNNLTNDWAKKVQLGVKTKGGKIIPQAIIHVINLNAGGDKASEVLAGFTPDAFVIDEVMKAPFIDQLNGAKPSFDTPYGKLCTAILSGCVCAGTKVWTNTGKLVNIEDLKQEEGILGYNGEGVSKEPITWMKPPAKKPCYRIEITGGNYIECSEDHPILTSHDNNKKNRAIFKRTDTLKKGDYVYMPDSINIFGNRQIEDARLVGLLIGDGHMTETTCTELSCGDEEIYEYVKEKYNIKIGRTFETKAGGIFRRIFVKDVKHIIRDAGIMGLVKMNKTLPKDINTYNKESLAELLGGYFDADGSAKRRQKEGFQFVRIALSSISLELLREVKFQLLKFGIQSNIVRRVTKDGYKPNSVSYVLSIDRQDSLNLFRENIKFLINKKQDVLDSTIQNTEKRTVKSKTIKFFEVNKDGKGKFFEGKSLKNLVLQTVKSVEYIGEKEVYNLTAGTTNTYLANGFITHNTGGNEELSRDALVVLNDPQDYDILPMNWDALERGMNPEDILWKRRKFGTFAPAAMSAKDGMMKIDSNLAKYLGRPESEELAKIKILLTDWKVCNEIIAADRKRLAKHKPSLTKEIVYYPNDPEEIFLSGKVNPFPREEAVRHLAYIREKGLTGRKVDIMRSKTSNKIEFDLSEKILPKFPHTGGFHDAPVLIFGEFPTEKPPRGLFVASLDDYKQEKADSDSLGCFIIFKRQSGNDEWGDRIAAIFTSRPNPHNKFHRTGYLLLEAYNAECLMENEDMDFKTFLDTQHKTEQYLVPSFNMAGDLTLKRNENRNYGISPSGNKSAIISQAISYCHRIHKMKDAEGIDYEVLGVELINDEMLLEEIINYKDGENHDRITTFGIGLIQAHYLDTNYVVALLKEKERKEPVKTTHNSKLFTHTRRPLF